MSNEHTERSDESEIIRPLYERKTMIGRRVEPLLSSLERRNYQEGCVISSTGDAFPQGDLSVDPEEIASNLQIKYD